MLANVPVVSVPSGVIIRLQADVGRPLTITLPVANVHVGCVIVPIVGTVGGVVVEMGITTFADAKEVHPEPLVTV